MLVEKNRAEEAINLLLDIIAINRNWEEKKANTLLMEVFSKVGAKSEAVKQGRKKLAKILF
jgi:thioredoxin-like negative regulator of GroEL